MVNKNLTTTELSYIAGFFDGEGCIFLKKSIKGKNYSYSLQIRVSATYVPTLEFVRDAFGGTVHLEKKYATHHKQSYGWGLVGKDAHRFLVAIIPYLREKRDQALLADEYVKSIGTGSSRARIISEKSQQEYYYRKLQEMKKVQVAPGQSVNVPANGSSSGLEQLRLVE